MLIATALVLLMTPALGLFYAGLVRSKNTLNTFMMCIAAIAVAVVTWAAVGYSLAFDEGNGIIGGFDYAFLNDVSFEPREGQTIPHLRLLRLPGDLLHHHHGAGLRRGGRADALRSASWSSSALWSVLVYSVLAHWGFGPGWLFNGGTLDFAGGIAVEMGSGFSALAAALVVGARKDYGRQALLPHNAVYVLLGAGLLWFGWFGFNGGSGFNTGQNSTLAFTNTLLTPACTLLAWFALDAIRGRRITAIGAATAIIVGCVGITPAGGFVSPGFAMLLGALVALPCYAVIAYRHPHPGRRDARRARRARGRRASPGSCSSASSPRPPGTGSPTAGSSATSTSSSTRCSRRVAAPAYAFGATFVLLQA